VVWNPWVDKSKTLSDFSPEDYKKMVCIEPGNVAKTHEGDVLGPGEEAVLIQVVSGY
jgi:glucose-6-phosphate 1-epimerase